MAYNKDLFRKMRSGGLTAKGSFVLADELDSIMTDITTLEGRQAAPVADIADTSTATAEDVGDKVNELLAALRTVGLLDT